MLKTSAHASFIRELFSSPWRWGCRLTRGRAIKVDASDKFANKVYPMPTATTIGPLLFTYTRDMLDTIAVQSGAAYYGLDVWPDGSRFVIGSANGRVIEFGAPELQISLDAGGLMLSWPSAVTLVGVQSSPTLSPSAFVDMEQQPLVTYGTKTNTAVVPFSGDQTYFRLRKY